MPGQSPVHLLRNGNGFIRKHFNGFREENHFCDVTLVCDDGASFRAHRVILASQSDKLRTILTEFEASQFCLYLAGVASQQLSSLLSFIYSGEARVSQRDLSAFLAAAQTLKIGGLMEDSDGEDITEDDFKEEVTYGATQPVYDVTDKNTVSLDAAETKNIEVPSTKYDCTNEVTGDVTDQREEEDDFIEEDKTLVDADLISQSSDSLNPRETKYLSLKEETPGDEEKEEEHAWDDAQSVSFEFIKSGRSTKQGIIVTHDRSYQVSLHFCQCILYNMRLG